MKNCKSCKGTIRDEKGTDYQVCTNCNLSYKNGKPMLVEKPYMKPYSMTGRVWQGDQHQTIMLMLNLMNFWRTMISDKELKSLIGRTIVDVSYERTWSNNIKKLKLTFSDGSEFIMGKNSLEDMTNAEAIATALKAEKRDDVLPWGKNWSSWDGVFRKEKLDAVLYYWWGAPTPFEIGDVFLGKKLCDYPILNYYPFEFVGFHKNNDELSVFKCLSDLEDYAETRQS